MAEKIVLAVEKRELTGKKAKQLRKSGIVPGVIYGSKMEATNIQVPIAFNIQKVISQAGYHTPVEITLDGKKLTALLKDVSYVPARSDIFNFSFQAVSANEKVTTEIPVELVNLDESPAKKAGLVILNNLDQLEVRAKTGDLPNALTADAMKLEKAEDKLTVADIKLPKGVELVDENLDNAIATVWEPAALEAKNAAADAAGAEVPETEVENGAETTAE